MIDTQSIFDKLKSFFGIHYPKTKKPNAIAFNNTVLNKAKYSYFLYRFIMLKLQPILWLLFVSFCYSQEQTVVTGSVYDNFGDPLPFANVVFKNTNIGILTDVDGNFKLTSQQKHSVLVVSYLGFTTVEYYLNASRTKNIRVILKEEGERLNEVVVISKPKKRLKKKENPAYAVLKNVWKRKKATDHFDYYQYKEYESIEIGITNLDTVFLKKIFKKNTDSIIHAIESEMVGNIYHVPINLKESYLMQYGNNIKRLKKKDIIAEKETGVKMKGFFFERIQSSVEDIDIDKDNILILNKNFISPIANEGFASYDYILNDSIVKNGKKTYKIFFFPRREEDYAFEGSFDIETPSYSVSRIDMKIKKNLRLEFLKELFFEQYYETVNDSLYYLVEKNMEAQFNLLTKSDLEKGLYLKSTSTYKDYRFNLKKDSLFYNNIVDKVSHDQFHKNLDYWKANIPESKFNASKRNITYLLENNNRINAFTGVGNVVLSGYINVNSWIQFGKWWDTFAFNDVEGLRLELGGRTFKSLHDRYRSDFYLAYGLKDSAVKYAFDSKYLLIREPRVRIIGLHSSDLQQLGSTLMTTNTEISSQVPGVNVLFSGGTNFFLSDIKKYALSLDLTIKNNFRIGTGFQYEDIQSADPNYFSTDHKSDNIIESKLTDFSINAFVQWTPWRKIFGYGVQQSIGKALYPSFTLKYTKGIKDIGTLDYNRIQFSYRHPFFLGGIGTTIFSLEMGKTLGEIPLTLTSPIPSDQAYSLTPDTFSLLNYYDLATDTSVTNHIEHHFNGFFVNRIPFLSKLQIKTLAFLSTVYGTTSDNNVRVNASDIVYNIPSENIYYEYGFGVENIGLGNIRNLRIDFIWRTNLPIEFQYNPDKAPPSFGIRIGVTSGSF